VSSIKYWDGEYKTKHIDDDVDECPHCGNHIVIGELTRDYDSKLSRFILRTSNEPKTSRPFVKIKNLNSDRLYNDPAVTRNLIPRWNKIDNLKHELDLVLEDKAEFESNGKVEWGKRHKFNFWCRNLFTIKNFTRDGIIKIASFDTMKLIDSKITYLTKEIKELTKGVTEVVKGKKYPVVIRKGINHIKLDVIKTDPVCIKKRKEFLEIKDMNEKVFNKIVFGAMKSGAIKMKLLHDTILKLGTPLKNVNGLKPLMESGYVKTIVYKPYKYDKEKSLFANMDDYGVHKNVLKEVDEIMLKRFFPNYARKHHIEITDGVIEAWNKVYGNGDDFFNIMEGLAVGYDAPEPMVISKFAFRMLSRAMKSGSIIILRDKHTYAYERKMDKTIQYNSDKIFYQSYSKIAKNIHFEPKSEWHNKFSDLLIHESVSEDNIMTVGEWYKANKAIIESPSMDMDRGKDKVIDGVTYEYRPAQDKWVEVKKGLTEAGARRFVEYFETSDYDFDGEEEYVDLEYEYEFATSEEYLPYEVFDNSEYLVDSEDPDTDWRE